MTDMRTRTTAEDAPVREAAGPNGYFKFLLYGGISAVIAGVLFLAGSLQVARIDRVTDIDGSPITNPLAMAATAPLVLTAVICFAIAFFMLLSVIAVKAAKN